MGIESTTCTSCHTQHPIKKLKAVTRDVEQERAKEVRQSAKRDRLGDLDVQTAEELDLEKPIESVVVDELIDSDRIKRSIFIGQCQLEHGMTRGTVNHAIDSLIEKGIVVSDGDKIWVTD